MGESGVLDAVVVGGGQAGLAAGYHLRRAGADFVILDRPNAAIPPCSGSPSVTGEAYHAR